MALVILMFASGALVALATWVALQRAQHEYARYRARFRHQAERGLADFFLFLDPAQLWLATLAFAGAAGVLLFAVGLPFSLAALVAAACLAMPRVALGWARRRRLARIDAQLPDFLLALAGALRSGLGLQSGLRLVVQHTSPPIAHELHLLLKQQRLGLTFDDALDALQRRVDTEAVGLVVAAIKVAGQTGGSLAETLERISATLRTRHQLLGRIRALTAQGRMQAWIMAALPVILAVALHAIDPASMSLLWRTAQGWALMGLIGVLEVAGIMLVRRIVRIDV